MISSFSRLISLDVDVFEHRLSVPSQGVPWQKWFSKNMKGLSDGTPWCDVHSRITHRVHRMEYWQALSSNSRRLAKVPLASREAILLTMLEDFLSGSHFPLFDKMNKVVTQIWSDCLYSWGAASYPSLLARTLMPPQRDELKDGLLRNVLEHGGNVNWETPSKDPSLSCLQYAMAIRHISPAIKDFVSDRNLQYRSSQGENLLHVVLSRWNIPTDDRSPVMDSSSKWILTLNTLLFLDNNLPHSFWGHVDSQGQTPWMLWEKSLLDLSLQSKHTASLEEGLEKMMTTARGSFSASLSMNWLTGCVEKARAYHEESQMEKTLRSPRAIARQRL